MVRNHQMIFYQKTNEVHNIRSYNIANNIDQVAEQQHVRVALSSPAMEVGVDLDNLTEAILFKAIQKHCIIQARKLAA